MPRTALNYHPERGWGLTGGIWPDVAFMFAYSCSTHQPDVMINIMRGTFRQYELDPTNQNTVPGQFSEWYHGESLVNNGMKLSPWFPPKYLWTAVEGVRHWAIPRAAYKSKPSTHMEMGKPLKYALSRECSDLLCVLGQRALEYIRKLPV